MTHFTPFLHKMQAAGLPHIFIQTFAGYYEQLAAGETGLIPESVIEPVTDLPDADQLPPDLTAVGQRLLAQTAVIKLNGGLGTSMGLRQAKSLLPVKNGLSFLDIIARQVMQAGVPLLLMNSFATDADSLAALAAYPELKRGLPLRFLQHKEPKVTQADLTPAKWPANPALEWCPPGHGDIYTALVTSGALDALLDAGIRYAFASNADNLGAVIDERILGYFAESNFPFMMEVADRTEMDKKGGHLARSAANGRFLLRESAQCPDEDAAAYQDIGRHRFFNTNNLWLNLPALRETLAARDYRLGLPLIRNSKRVDPRDPTSTPVYQLETAMGSAVAVFAGAAALRVPRSRFAPVKKTDGLLAVRSDAYVMTDDFHVELAPEREGRPLLVALDGRFTKFVQDMEARFPYGPPSLAACDRLTIRGDVRFGRNVVCREEVTLVNEEDEPLVIPDGAVLT